MQKIKLNVNAAKNSLTITNESDSELELELDIPSLAYEYRKIVMGINWTLDLNFERTIFGIRLDSKNN